MIYLGPAGVGGETLQGLQHIKDIGLNAVEIEFVRQVYMTNEAAKLAGSLIKKLKLKTSIHAPYFINLASEEKPKVCASMNRILQSCERGHYLGAEYIVFHPGFYGKRSKEETYELIKNAILDIKKKIKKQRWTPKLAPETTGKINVFGSLDETLALVKETKCHFTVDFAHLKARQQGKINYEEIFDKIKQFKHIHAHFSGIEFTAKGEKKHLLTTKQDLLPLLKEIIKRKTDITIINESPDPVGDTLKTKQLLESLK